MALSIFLIMFYFILVHSRIKRVFYSLPNEQKMGGLNKTISINNMDKLNHKYLVFYDIESDYAKNKFKK